MKIDKINDEFIVDCTNNLKEERQQVYKFLVDNRNYKKSYLEDYYPVIVCNKKQNNSNWDSLEKYYNWVDSKKDIPVYTFEQFEEMYLDEFVLPEKWCIKITRENLSFCKSLKNEELGFIRGYYSSIASSEGNFGFIIIPNGYKEITFEQFKKYVLDQNNMENKKIIGYKLKFAEYTKAVRTICHLIEDTDVSIINMQTSIQKLKEAGVLNLWFEPVYEKEKQIVKMHSSNKGEFEIEVIDGKAYYRPAYKHLPKEWIKDIIDSFEKVLSKGGIDYPYNVEVSSLNVGCYHGTKKEDWGNVYKLLR